MKITIESKIGNVNTLELDEIINVAKIAKNIEEIKWALDGVKFGTLKYGFGSSHMWVKSTVTNNNDRLIIIE